MSYAASNLLRIHCTGDSITSQANRIVGDWPSKPGSLIDQSRALPINFTAAPIQAYTPGRLGQAVGGYLPFPQQGRRQVITVYGVGGRTVSGLAADLPASIYSWKPNIVILEIGTNDFGGGTDVTPGGVFQTQYNAVLDGIATNLPGCKVLCCTPPIRAESWVAAGPHLSDGLDTWAGLTRMAESIAARASFCELVDLITPAFALTRIIQPVAASSVTPFELTVDSLHPSLYGRVAGIANPVMSHLNWS